MNTDTQHAGVIDLQTKIVHQDGKMFVGRSQDCVPIAEYAKRQHNEGAHGSADMKHAARIPNVIVEKYMNDHGVTFEQFLADPTHIRRVVEDPANAAFRIWKGAL
ncbi:MAG: hypothetical protein V4508_02245 [Pseudomonadota bacterium]